MPPGHTALSVQAGSFNYTASAAIDAGGESGRLFRSGSATFLTSKSFDFSRRKSHYNVTDDVYRHCRMQQTEAIQTSSNLDERLSITIRVRPSPVMAL